MKNPQFLLKDDAFVIEKYNAAQPFSSFLPGIAGEYGKPMWVFYTNRGQGVASFGIRNKNSAMLEFQPANKAYLLTPLTGFRTFVRGAAGRSAECYEPFQPAPGPGVRQTMRIRAEEFEIEEVHAALGLRMTVVYYTAPNETQPLLIRRVRLENLKVTRRNLEIADGLAQVVPFGLAENLLKQMSRTMEAFAEVTHAVDRLPFFKLKVEPSDRPEMERIEGGFFSFTVSRGTSLPVRIDPRSVFGNDTSLQRPLAWEERGSRAPLAEQAESSTACALAALKINLPSRGVVEWTSYFGQANSWPQAQSLRRQILKNSRYADDRRAENHRLLRELTDQFALHAADSRLEAYTRQTFLDNVLRGGQPWIVNNGKRTQVFHYYTRKHGDMERDYNFFELAPTYFSQGNGNFRDVNQNRRVETFVYPGVEAANVETFFNLIQLDGFNPLVVRYETFTLPAAALRAVESNFPAQERAAWREFLSQPFSPGALWERLCGDAGVASTRTRQQFDQILSVAEKFQEAAHGEGYWVDHWFYSLDLLENFVAVYPDHLRSLLAQRKEFTYYDSDHIVQPRSRKTILLANGKVRQMKAVIRDAEKAAMIKRRTQDPFTVRGRFGEGEVYRTTLLAKLLGLAAIKTASLDPAGIGLEMEADKPGWCDALNGLPGLFGSSVNEAFALRRLLRFLETHLPAALEEGETVTLPVEMADLIEAVTEILGVAHGNDFFRTWDALALQRESFRERIRLGVGGEESKLTQKRILAFVKTAAGILDRGLAQASKNSGMITTYFMHEIVDFEKLPPVPADPAHPEESPLQAVRARRFKTIPVVPFLEGPVHALRATQSAKGAAAIYRAVRASELYDRKLGMYRLNTPLGRESFEMGRASIFTPGWLENESIFLHMHYKFLLETLRSGLAKEFFQDLKKGLVAFQDPAVYGRSILENSSFIASSRFPDSRLHGNGFVARLTGATVEWLSMVLYMGLGSAPFQSVQGTLRFAPVPTLAGWLFSPRANGEFPRDTFGFKLFGRTWIVYHNPGRRDTFAGSGRRPVRFRLTHADGKSSVHEGRVLNGQPARDLRDGKLARVDIDLGV